MRMLRMRVFFLTLLLLVPLRMMKDGKRNDYLGELNFPEEKDMFYGISYYIDPKSGADINNECTNITEPCKTVSHVFSICNKDSNVSIVFTSSEDNSPNEILVEIDEKITYEHKKGNVYINPKTIFSDFNTVFQFGTIGLFSVTFSNPLSESAGCVYLENVQIRLNDTSFDWKAHEGEILIDISAKGVLRNARIEKLVHEKKPNSTVEKSHNLISASLIDNCVFSKNNLDNTNLVYNTEKIINSKFIENSADFLIYDNFDKKVTVFRSKFDKNDAIHIYSVSATPKIVEKCNFTRSRSIIFSLSIVNSLVVENCRFEENKEYVFYNFDTPKLEISNSEFRENVNGILFSKCVLGFVINISIHTSTFHDNYGHYPVLAIHSPLFDDCQTYVDLTSSRIEYNKMSAVTLDGPNINLRLFDSSITDNVITKDYPNVAGVDCFKGSSVQLLGSSVIEDNYYDYGVIPESGSKKINSNVICPNQKEFLDRLCDIDFTLYCDQRIDRFYLSSSHSRDNAICEMQRPCSSLNKVFDVIEHSPALEHYYVEVYGGSYYSEGLHIDQRKVVIEKMPDKKEAIIHLKNSKLDLYSITGISFDYGKDRAENSIKAKYLDSVSIGNSFNLVVTSPLINKCFFHLNYVTVYGENITQSSFFQNHYKDLCVIKKFKEVKDCVFSANNQVFNIYKPGERVIRTSHFLQNTFVFDIGFGILNVEECMFAGNSKTFSLMGGSLYVRKSNFSFSEGFAIGTDCDSSTGNHDIYVSVQKSRFFKNEPGAIYCFNNYDPALCIVRIFFSHTKFYENEGPVMKYVGKISAFIRNSNITNNYSPSPIPHISGIECLDHPMVDIENVNMENNTADGKISNFFCTTSENKVDICNFIGRVDYIPCVDYHKKGKKKKYYVYFIVIASILAGAFVGISIFVVVLVVVIFLARRKKEVKLDYIPIQ